MSTNTFTFNGITSSTYGVYVGGQNTFNAPHRIVSKTAIPGRNGELVWDEGRFANVLVSYNIVVMNEFRTKTDNIKAWLLSPIGYCRLEDTYHPDHFRMGMVADNIDFETSAYNLTGKTQVVFDCKPQRFLKSGETATSLTANGSVTNPTLFESKPLIRVYGSGTCSFTVNNQTITITGVNSYVDIDCETMNVYKGTTNMNANTTLGAGGFPVLTAGSNGFQLGTGTTKLDITGRWWTI